VLVVYRADGKEQEDAKKEEENAEPRAGMWEACRASSKFAKLAASAS
jgi:hypothetical protein